VDELVSRRGLRTPFLRMAKDGTVLPGSAYTRGGGAGATIGDQAADDRVLAQLADGATLVLQALHRTWPTLVSFAAELSGELGHPVQINAYVTPPQNTGFAPHYDVHDVFVLQVAGRKHWRLHAPVVKDPLPDQPWQDHADAVSARADEAPLLDEVLRPGDALYLPRGTVHSASALGETSIHLTVGIHPVTRYDLVRHLLRRVAHDPQLRRALPAGIELADPDLLAPHVTATVAALHAAVDAVPATELADAVAEQLRRQTRPAPISPLVQLQTASHVQPDTALVLRRGLRPQVDEDGSTARLRVLDHTVEVPGGAWLKAVLTGTVFTPADLTPLPADQQLDVAAQLLRAGVITPA
jgi:lysine-specific demethylase/histidyl-hydroxylase NO66